MNSKKFPHWNAYFDKGQACPVPHKFPIIISKSPQELLLEEFDDEEPKDDVMAGKGRLNQVYEAARNEKLVDEHSQRNHVTPTLPEQKKVTIGYGRKEASIFFKRNEEKTEQFQEQIDDSGFSKNNENISMITKEPKDTTDTHSAFSQNVQGPARIDSANSSTDSDEAISEDVGVSTNHALPMDNSDSDSSGFESDENDAQTSTSIPSDTNRTKSRISFQFPVVNEPLIESEVISLETAKELKKVIFGDSMSCFSDLWTNECIVIKGIMPYEIRIFKDGPGGLLACLQAHIIKNYLFKDTVKGDHNNLVRGNAGEKCLVAAITDIIWKAGEHVRANVALCQHDCNFFGDSNYKEDGFTEKIRLFQFSDRTSLHNFCFQHLDHFKSRPGCVLLFYSVVLSRTIPRILEDLDGCQSLLESDGSESQALINLLLTGKAVANCFNGQKEIVSKEKKGKIQLIQGITERSEIGILNSNEIEDPKKYEVGSRLKTPLFPIWVIKNYRQFLTVHSKRKDLLNDWKLERRFDLHCKMETSRHFDISQEEIRLTVDTVSNFEIDEDDVHSTLEEILRTKWSDAVIDWNGFKKIL